jgi:hypothetical protein
MVALASALSLFRGVMLSREEKPEIPPIKYKENLTEAKLEYLKKLELKGTMTPAEYGY